MRALPYVLLPILALSLSSCVQEQKAALAKAAVTVKAMPAGDSRKAEIRRQLAAICPQPLGPASLNRMADFLESHANDLRAIDIINDLDRLDREATICRRGPK